MGYKYKIYKSNGLYKHYTFLVLLKIEVGFYSFKSTLIKYY